MKKMNIPLMGALLLVSIVVCPLLYYMVGPKLDDAQMDVLKLLGVIAACSAAFCFFVGEATGNNSQGHLKSMLMGNHCLFPVIDGKIVCGGAQEIYLVDFDGPQKRRVYVEVMGEA